MPWETPEQQAERMRLLGPTQAGAARFREALEPRARPNYSYLEQLGAAFPQENVALAVGSWLRHRSTNYGEEPGFDPEPFLGRYAQYREEFPGLTRARSRAALSAEKLRIDQELRRREILDGMGFWRGLAVFGPAGLLSPENLIPVGTAIRSAGIVGKAATRSVARSAARVGAEGLITAAAAEAALQPTQGFRTAEESALNIVGSGVFGSVLGGAGAQIGKSRRAALKRLIGVEALTDIPAEVDKAIDRVMDPTTPEGKALAEDIEKLTMLEDSPGTFVFGESDPLRGAALKALQEVNPKLARMVGSENRATRAIMRAFKFQPAMRLAMSNSPNSRLIGRILTGHFLADDVPEAAQGLSVEGALNLFEHGAKMLQVDQAKLYEKLRKGPLAGIDENELFEMVGLAMRRGDQAAQIPSFKQGREYDPFATVRGNSAAEAGIKELAQGNRKFLDMAFRTAKIVGAYTDGPKARTKSEQIMSLLDGTYLSRLVDQEYVRANPDQFRAAIVRGLEARREELLPEFLSERAEIERQLAGAADETDAAYYKGQLDDVNEVISKLDPKNGFTDLAYSIESNYRPHNREQRVAPSNPFMARVLDIDERYLEEFLINDIRAIQNRVTRSIIPDLALADQMDRRFGGSAEAGGSLVRQLQKDLADLDKRVEAARGYGVDQSSAEDIALQMDDALDKSKEARLLSDLRLLRSDEDIPAAQKAVHAAYQMRKNHRDVILRQRRELREKSGEISGLVHESKQFRSERKDLRPTTKLDEDLSLTESQYFEQLEQASDEVADALTRNPIGEWTWLTTSHGLSDEDWHAFFVGMGYTTKEVDSFRRFIELFPPMGDKGLRGQMYESWRNGLLGEKPTGLVTGKFGDDLRKTLDAIGEQRKKKRRSTAAYTRFVEELLHRKDFLDDPGVQASARHMEEARLELESLARQKKAIEKTLEVERTEGQGDPKMRAATPSAEELGSLRAQWEFVLKAINDLTSRITKARGERDSIASDIHGTQRRMDSFTDIISGYARRVSDQVGASKGSQASRLAQLVPRRTMTQVSGELTGEQTMRRIDALNRMVHAQVADDRRHVYGVNTSAEHLTTAIERAYRREEPTEKNRRRMEKDQIATETILERMRNRHGVEDTDLAAWGKRVRDFNYMTKMGSVLLSSLPDLAMAVGTAGFVPYANALAKNIRTIIDGKIPKNTLAEWIYAVERSGAMMRNEKMLGVDDDYVPRGALDRKMAKMRETFTDWTFIRRWNAFNKAVASQAIESRVVKTILAGKDATKQDRALLQFFGIADRDWDDLKTLLERSHSKDKALVGDFYFANANRWRSETPEMKDFSTDRLRNLRLSFEGAILKGVQDTIITPSAGDLPTIATKHPLGKMLFQFRAFSLAAMQRFLLPGVQRVAGRGDVRPAFAAALATAMGMGVYALSDHLKGRDPFRDEVDKDGDKHSWQKRWAWEGIDRGGVFGILTEAASSLDKAMGLGLLESSRFQSRSQLDAILGPSFAFGADAVNTLGTFSDGELSEGEAARFRRLTPFQNLLILRAFLDLGPNLPRAGSGRYYEKFQPIEQNVLEGLGVDLQ